VLRFDWSDIAERTAQVYAELAVQPGGARRATRRSPA
jgi:hypothetical protein